MLVPLSWLKEFVPVDISNEKLAEKLLLSGTKVENIIKKDGEIVLELEITPNRPDTLSILGVAREVSALFGKDLILPETNLLTPQRNQTGKVSLTVRGKHLCPSYSLVKLSSIRIKPSPEWIQNYLRLSGIRSINNVVDITNFVMLELGQPMHAFDSKKIAGELVLRSAKHGEVVTTLDGVERKLNQGAIIIEDQEKLVDLAGLMGGANSEIDENTEEILLMVPVYDSLAIRKASIHTGLRTEASNRFEKKLDPNMHPFAINRAVKLLVEEAGAAQSSAIFSSGYPVKERVLQFRLNLINEVLGIELTQEEVFDLLTALGFRVSMSPLQETEINIQIPSFRADVTLEEDIVEEIGRMYGYNNFPKTLPTGPIPLQKEIFEEKYEDKVKEFLQVSGHTQLTGYSLVSESDLVNFGFTLGECLKVLHPTSLEFVYLRPSLLINLVKAFAINKEFNRNLFFEIAKEFRSETDKSTGLPRQNQAIVVGNDFSFGKLKGEVESLLGTLEENFNQILIKGDTIWETGVIFETKKGTLAKVGKLNPHLLEKFEIKTPIFAAWLDLKNLLGYKSKIGYKTLPKFPSVLEDISFYLPEEFLINSVITQVKEMDRLVNSVELKDIYVREGRRSFTIGLEFRNEAKTLEGKEVEEIRGKIEKTLSKKFQAKIRQD